MLFHFQVPKSLGFGSERIKVPSDRRITRSESGVPLGAGDFIALWTVASDRTTTVS